MRLPGPFQGLFPSAVRRVLCAALALSPLLSLRAQLKGYTQPAAIAEADLINRDPVISETGLIAWMAYSKSADLDEGGGVKIFAYVQGQRQRLTDNTFWAQAANTRPQAFGDRILWQTTRDPSAGIGDKVDFVLQEVPDAIRDAQFPELPAFFAALDKPADNPGDERSNFNLDPSMQRYEGPFSNIYEWAQAYYFRNGGSNEVSKLVEQMLATNKTGAIKDTRVYSPSYFDVSPKARRKTTEHGEICQWTQEKGVEWLTSDFRMDVGVHADGDLIAWQRAKGFPFGWEIMVRHGLERFQITTNFYYDLGPVVTGDNVIWYGWDGSDYEIYRWNLQTKLTTQVTTNDYDDVSPVAHGDLIAWEGYPTVEAEIYTHNLKTGDTLKISKGLEDDLNPVVFDGKVVWQGFDGDDFELWIWDSNAEVFDETTKKKVGKVDRLTDNAYDDVNPSLRDGLLVWMGYADNWDAEIFAYDLASKERKQVTENDYEDKEPRTAKGLIVWQADTGKSSEIYLASPDT